MCVGGGGGGGIVFVPSILRETEWGLHSICQVIYKIVTLNPKTLYIQQST